MKKYITSSIFILLFPLLNAYSQHFTFQGNNLFGLEYYKPDSTESVIKLLFYDVDSDDDMDAISIGLDSIDNSGNLTYNKITYFISLQENIGNKWNPIFAIRKPFMDNFPFPNGYFFPSIADLNNDYKADLYVTAGVYSAANIIPLYYERTALTGDDQFNIIDASTMQLHSFIGGSFFMPELADMDMDGDFDILLSGFLQDIDPNTAVEQKPIFMYAKNEGTITQPSFVGWYHNPYGLAANIDQPQISIVGDIDNDNDNDILSVTTLDTFTVFKFLPNIPQSDGRPWFQSGTVSPFGLPSAGQNESFFPPTLVDIDADGDLDLFVVQQLLNSGTGIAFYKNDICIPETEDITQTICSGESVTIGNNIYTTAGEYFATVTEPDNCDKLVHLILNVIPNTFSNLSETICEGESITVGNQNYNHAGVYEIKLSSSNGCDSIVNLNLNVIPNSTFSMTQSICEGETVTVNNNVYNQTGQYEINLPSSNGCDSTINLNLTVLPSSTIALNESICAGESVTVGNQTFNQTGQFVINLSNTNGCDSMVNLNLIVYPIESSSIVNTLCQGESIMIGNQTFNQSGVYEVKLSTINGCDSIISANLTFISLNNDVTQTTESLTSIASNVTYQWFDCNTGLDITDATSQSFTPIVTGSYAVKVSDSNGCKNTSSCYAFIVTKTEDIEFAANISLFPNPTSDAVTIINNTGLKLSNISFINSDGKTVKSISASQSNNINISDLHTGNYIVEINVGERKVVKKLVVVK